MKTVPQSNTPSARQDAKLTIEKMEWMEMQTSAVRRQPDKLHESERTK
jgi:hypothetical protein